MQQVKEDVAGEDGHHGEAPPGGQQLHGDEGLGGVHGEQCDGGACEGPKNDEVQCEIFHDELQSVAHDEPLPVVHDRSHDELLCEVHGNFHDELQYGVHEKFHDDDEL